MSESENMDDEAWEARGLRGQAQIMLDPLRRGGGGRGGARERSAWVLLACYADSVATVALACEGAISKGASATDIASWAIESNAPLALRWCVEKGGLGPRSLLFCYGAQKELGQIAIDSEAGRCVGMLDEVAGPIDAPRPDGGREDGLVFAARSLKLVSLQVLLARRRPSARAAQEAMDELGPVVGRHWSSGHSNPALLAKALMEHGGRLGASAMEGVGDRAPHAHRIAERLFVAWARTAGYFPEGSSEGQRALADTWSLIEEVPGWTSWAGPAELPMLGEYCLSRPGLKIHALASIFKDDPGLLRDPRSALALVMGAQSRTALGVDEPCLLLSSAMKMGCEPPVAARLAAVLSDAMPVDSRGVVAGSKKWAGFYAQIEPLCVDPALGSLAREVGGLYERVSRLGGPTSDQDWAPWESAALGLASFAGEISSKTMRPRL